MRSCPAWGRLIFAEDGVTPSTHLLRDLKNIAEKAGLNSDELWQHKFRAIGCSTLLQSGMLLPDVMALEGWKDVTSVKRYMGPLDADGLEKAVEKAWAVA